MHNEVFDSDYLIIKNDSHSYLIITLICLVIIIITMCIIKKNIYYSNKITIIDKNKAALIVIDDYVEDIKKIRKIVVGNISYEYSIEKIEEKDKYYLITIAFQHDVDLKNDTYIVCLKKERLIKYFYQKIKGEIWEELKMKN